MEARSTNKHYLRSSQRDYQRSFKGPSWNKYKLDLQWYPRNTCLSKRKRFFKFPSLLKSTSHFDSRNDNGKFSIFSKKTLNFSTNFAYTNVVPLYLIIYKSPHWTLKSSQLKVFMTSLKSHPLGGNPVW